MSDEMEDTMAAYDLESKAQRIRYGEDAEGPSMPRPPYGHLTANAPDLPIQQRIAELCQQVTEAGHMLAEARGRHHEALAHKEKCEAGFAQCTDALMQAMAEHREGTPRGVPYPR